MRSRRASMKRKLRLTRESAARSSLDSLVNASSFEATAVPEPIEYSSRTTVRTVIGRDPYPCSFRLRTGSALGSSGNARKTEHDQALRLYSERRGSQRANIIS